MDPTPTRPLFVTKTAAVQAVVAIAAFIPVVREFVAQHPTEVILGLSLLNLGVRLITKGKVTLFSE
jgi:hypothetical protein